MPLTMAQPGESSLIKKVGGRPETRKFLEGMGFVGGGRVFVFTKPGGNVIVEIKGARVAVDSGMAAKIMI